MTDRALVRELEDDATRRDTDEKLLVHERDGDVELALFIDEAVVERLSRDDPTACLHQGNLSDYWTALEGVSHFLYLAWNAGFGRGVSLLELEMQAEVDKYVSAAFVLAGQGGRRVPGTLRRWLFEHVRYDDQLDEPDRERYVDASYFAGKYCAQLEKRYLRGGRGGSLMSELRRFYRMKQGQKIERIESAACTATA